MDGLFKIVLLLAIVPVFAILLKIFLPSIKGLVGELLVRYTLKSSLPASYYTVLNDVTLETKRGTTQIDHIAVSPYGIFVIETKHLSGWIFGSENDAQWTRTFYRSKVGFQNPLRQNHAHIKALQELLGLDYAKFHSLVVFTGSAEFKTPMPVNVTMLGGLRPFIQVRTEQLLDYDEVARINRMIRSRRLTPGRAATAAHIASLKAQQRSVTGMIEEARCFARHAVTTMIAIKAATGVVMMAAVLFFAGQALMNVGDMFNPSPVAEASSGSEQSPFLQNAPAPRIDLPGAAEQTPVVHGNTRTHLEQVRLDQQAAARKRVRDERLAWESSLMCGYSADAKRCSCYEPNGGRVTMDFDSCRTLADKNGGLARR